MTNLTTNESSVLAELRAAAESTRNAEWDEVYLDNARPVGMSGRTFSAILANLTKKDLYQPLDGFAFGLVRRAS